MIRPVDNLLGAIGLPGGTSIHFVDLENLVGTGLYTKEQVELVCDLYASRATLNSSDLFLISSGTQNKEATYSGWNLGNAIFQFRKGKDGADQALVRFFESIENPTRYQNMFIASGDHSLEVIARRAQGEGLTVTIVTGRGGVSRALRDYPQLQLQGR